ncbi:hypothetical protein C7972_1157 [Arenibacter sp. ARW7G5Y1]|nr:hypothetical protein C7972_1157 [Arenibacter sp. ARW7G5Y1]
MLFSGSIFFKISHLNTMILISKIIFHIGVFMTFFDIGLRRRLTFYHNFGLSKTVLILISFLLDSFITLLFINIVRLF